MYFQGESRTRSYLDGTSVKRYATEVVVNEMRFWGWNSNSSALVQSIAIKDDVSGDNTFDEYSENT